MNAAAQSRLDSIEPHDDAVPRADVHDGLVRNAIAHPVPRLIERRKDFARVETTFAELPEARRDERRGPSPEIVKCDERGDRESSMSSASRLRIPSVMDSRSSRTPFPPRTRRTGSVPPPASEPSRPPRRPSSPDTGRCRPGIPPHDDTTTPGISGPRSIWADREIRPPVPRHLQVSRDVPERAAVDERDHVARAAHALLHRRRDT